MITNWRVANFKSLRKLTELELGPLTLFAGSNSSGKSTLIQSILLVAQTVVSRVGSRSVVLNGNLVKLGQFDDLRSHESTVDAITIGWECIPRAGVAPQPLYGAALPGTVLRQRIALSRIACALSFEVAQTGGPAELRQLQPRLVTCDIRATARSTPDRESLMSIEHHAEEAPPIPEKLERLRLSHTELADQTPLEYEVKLDQRSLAEIREDLPSAEPIGCVLRHFLPERLFVRYNELEERATALATAITETPGRYSPRYIFDREETPLPQKLLEFLEAAGGESVRPVLEFSGRSGPPLTLGEWVDRARRVTPQQRTALRRALNDKFAETRDLVMAASSAHYEVTNYRLPMSTLDAVRYLDYFFSQGIRYLGPLRDEPKPLYPLAATVDPSDVGLRGEYTAAVLDLHRRQPVNYLPPSNFFSPAVQPAVQTRHFEFAVREWLQYLGVAERIETSDMGKLGHELRVFAAGTIKAQDLTHVGVGVSQVLPILVTALLAPPDTTLIFEQPELHLHPRVQSLLGDFFLSMGLVGKQCIIETHSEYLINRLRFRSAAAPNTDVASLIKMFFVEKRDGDSSFRNVDVNEYGAILDWPEGFFDQSQREAEEILRAATAKRRIRHDN